METHCLTAIVTRQFFPKSGNSFTGFWAGEIQCLDTNKKFKASGPVEIKAKHKYNFIAALENDLKWGPQLKIQSASLTNEIDKANMARFIARDRALRGIGVAKAKILVDEYGSEIFKINTTPYPPQITSKDISLIKAVYENRPNYYDGCLELAGAGVPEYLIRRLHNRFGISLFQLIKEDPYSIIMSMKYVGFPTADNIAINLGVKANDPIRLKKAILHILDEESNEGHIWGVTNDIIGKTAQMLSLSDLQALNEAVQTLINDKEITAFENNQIIALRELADSESIIAKEFKANMDNHNKFFDKDIKAKPISEKLNEKQLNALEIALHNQIMILTGAAGTGKTFTIREILNAYGDLRGNVRMCAPTGKAARRMHQMSGDKALTIHRLLRYTKGVDGDYSFEYNEGNKLKADVIIVDEVSMVDSWLMGSLIKAIDFERTNLILVGDPNQLPPVGAGNILRDLIKTNIKQVHLEVVQRSAGTLRQYSADVLSGTVHREDTNDWKVMDGLTSESAIVNCVRETLRNLLNGGQDIHDIQIIAPQHGGEAGVTNLNKEIRKIFFMTKGLLLTDEDRFYKPMDKVICTRNNYELDITNGSMGEVLSASEEDRMVEIRFNDKEDPVLIQDEDLKIIQFAYALTVHKVQGDQADFVMSVIQQGHDFMLSKLGRNLLYTAVTRAKKFSCIIGDKFTIDKTASISKIEERRTLLPGMM